MKNLNFREGGTPFAIFFSNLVLILTNIHIMIFHIKFIKNLIINKVFGEILDGEGGAGSKKALIYENLQFCPNFQQKLK